MKKEIIYIFLLNILFTSVTQGQTFESRYKVYGLIVEEKSQKPLKKVPIRVMPYNKEINTDNQGAFLFNMPEGNFSLIINHFPFDKKEINIYLKSDTTIKITLKTQSEINFIGELDVSALQRNADIPENIRLLTRNSFLQMPAIAGEKDVIKSLALSAGVNSSSEGAADLQVRGGQTGQNLYLQDGIPIYATSHFFGLISAYNPITVQSAKLYKAGYPAEHGGRLSSIVSIKTREPSLIKTSIETEINMLSSGLRISLPVIKNKLALTVSGRISNFSFFDITSLYNDDDDDKLYMSFGDLHTGLLWKLNENNQLKINWFMNNDKNDILQSDITSETQVWLKNKQNNFSFNWNNTVENKNNKLSVYRDSYSFDFGMKSLGNSTDFQIENNIISGISTIGLKDNLEIALSNKETLNIGINLDRRSFSPLWYQYKDSIVLKENIYNHTVLYEGFVFGNITLNLDQYGKINFGARTGVVSDKNHLIPLFEPRFFYQNKLKTGFAFNASIDRMSQTIQRIANSGLGYPFEIYLPSTDGIKPSDSWIFGLGNSQDIDFRKFKISLKAELWYKHMNNIVEFKDGYDVLTSVIDKSGITSGIEHVITQGKGKAYGVDFSSELRVKKISLLTDYTLMRSTCQFDELNYGIAYNAPTDIRHSISLTFFYSISEKWKLTANWQFMSGRPITLPEFIYQKPNYNILTGELDENQLNYELTSEKRNTYRTKPFQKLDIELNYSYIAFKKHNGNFSFGVYNAYNHYNPYIYIQGVEYGSDGTSKNIIKSLSLFPVMPTFSWSLKF
jgi:hypothetical protein